MSLYRFVDPYDPAQRANPRWADIKPQHGHIGEAVTWLGGSVAAQRAVRT